MKNIRLIVSSVAAVAALTATDPSVPEASAQTRDVRGVNWGDVTIPGQLCEVKGQIHLHNGHATVRHSGFGVALDVLTLAVTHGDLGHGLHVAALQIWCDNTGGTADGELAEGIMVFDSPGGQAHLLGTLTPQHKTSATVHIPYIVVNHIDTAGHVAVTEYFYNPTQLHLLSHRSRDHPLEVDRPHLHPGPDQDHEQLSQQERRHPGDDPLRRRSQPKIAASVERANAGVSPRSPCPWAGSTLTRLCAAITR